MVWHFPNYKEYCLPFKFLNKFYLWYYQYYNVKTISHYKSNELDLWNLITISYWHRTGNTAYNINCDQNSRLQLKVHHDAQQVKSVVSKLPLEGTGFVKCAYEIAVAHLRYSNDSWNVWNLGMIFPFLKS